MQRVPEPELMNDAVQASAYAQADFDEANSLFVDTFDSSFPGFDGLIYDLGCGPADIPIRLARRLPSTRIVAIDGAKAMLELAAAAVAAAGLDDRIALRQEHLAGPPPRALEGQAAAIVSNSLLHHLADPTVLWRWVKDCGRPGAAVMIMDLLRPTDEDQVRAIVDSYARDEPEVLRRDFYASLRAAYRPEEVRRQLVDAELGDFSVRQISPLHLCVRSPGCRP